jgi:tetratricopeptide (TPR) repeat protein
MSSDLVKLEREALALMNEGKNKRAAELFSKIVKERPDWEHGHGFYNLAGCYEDLGDLDKAEENYRRALEYNAQDEIFLGGYASFLYLHRDPQSAFEEYLKLWKLECSSGNKVQAEKTMLGLRELSKRLRLTPEEFTQRLEAP